MPAEEAELDTLLHVALAVALNLGLPEGGVGLGEDEVGAIFVAVPKASVDEDDGLVFAKHDVGCAGQAFDVHPIAESAREEVAAHHHLGLRVSAADAGHASVALFRCQSVGHGGLFVVSFFVVFIILCANIRSFSKKKELRVRFLQEGS